MRPSRIPGAVVAAALVACPFAAAPSPLSAPGASPGVDADPTRGPVRVRAVAAGERLTGAVFIGYRGVDGETTGAIVTLAPIRRGFVQVGAELTPRSPDGDVRLLWGIGLEEDREGTFFLHVQDPGPIRPGGAWTLRTAEASVGYKVRSLRAGPFALGLTPFATVPFAGGPYAGARTALTVGRTWFVSAGIGRTVPGVFAGATDPERWRVSFAFGRWDARPGGLFVTYRERLFDGRFGGLKPDERKGQGILAMGVNWSM